MSLRIFAITLCTAMLCSIAAQASEATDIADRAGFLLGQSYRCGMAHSRIAQSQALITKLIEAFATEDDDQEAATNQFTKSYVAGTLPELSRDPVTSCRAIRAAIKLLEQHRLAATNRSSAKLNGEVAAQSAKGSRYAFINSPDASIAQSGGWGE